MIVNGRITAFRYAVHGDLPNEVIAELRRAHQFRNVLIEIERHHAERTATAWADRPDLAALLEERTYAEAAVAHLSDQAESAERRASPSGSASPQTRSDLFAARTKAARGQACRSERQAGRLQRLETDHGGRGRRTASGTARRLRVGGRRRVEHVDVQRRGPAPSRDCGCPERRVGPWARRRSSDTRTGEVKGR